MRFRSLGVAISIATFSCSLLAGCGGHSRLTPAPAPPPPQGGPGTASGTLTIVVPKKPKTHRKRIMPMYVSPATQSLRVKIGAVDTVVALTSPSPCTVSASSETCTIALALAPGANQSLTVITYASLDGSGTPLSQNTVLVNIVAGQANQIKISLGGVATTWALTVYPGSIQAYAASTVTAVYTAYDAAGYPIVGLDPHDPLFDVNGNQITPALSITSGPGSVGTPSGNSWSITENGPRTGSVQFQLSSSTGLPAAATANVTIVPGDDWNTQSHDMKRSGFDPLPSPITKATAPQLQLKWSRSFPGTKFYASPIVVNGTVYVVPTNNILYAIDAQTGVIKWQTPIVPQYPTYQGFMTPSLYDGKIFVGSHTSNGILAAVDPITGTVLWRTGFQPGGFRSTPVSVNGTLYIGESFGDPPACQPGGIYGYDENTGTLDMKWVTSPLAAQQDGGGVWGPVTWTGSTIAFGTGNTCLNNPATGDAIVGVRPSTSNSFTDLWHIQTVPDATKDDDDVASGVLDLNNVGYASAKNGYLYAFNLDSGNVSWSKWLGAPNKLGGFATPGYVGGTLFASRGYTYTSATGGMLYGLDLDGNIKWQIQSTGILLGQVVGVNDVAFAQIDNSINALDPATGQILWTYATQGSFEASPAIVPSGLFVNDLSGTLYAFDLPATPNARRMRRFGQPLRRAIKGVTNYPAPPPPKFCLLP